MRINQVPRGGIHWDQKSVQLTRNMHKKVKKEVKHARQKSNEQLAKLKNPHYKTHYILQARRDCPGYFIPEHDPDKRFNPHMAGLKKSNRILSERQEIMMQHAIYRNQEAFGGSYVSLDRASAPHNVID